MSQTDVYKLLKKYKKWMTSQMILDKSNKYSRGSVQRCLLNLFRHGLIDRETILNPNKNGRKYVYSYKIRSDKK